MITQYEHRNNSFRSDRSLLRTERVRARRGYGRAGWERAVEALVVITRVRLKC
jgi:hypothetical protein